MLMEDPETGMQTTLTRMAPGAVLTDHQHAQLEQTRVLEGSPVDHEGEAKAGSFRVWRPAGSCHTASAPNGALLLGFFLKPNTFSDACRVIAPGARPQSHEVLAISHQDRVLGSATGLPREPRDRAPGTRHALRRRHAVGPGRRWRHRSVVAPFTIGNRFAIQPMEGWDGYADGRPENTFRRWRHFGSRMPR